MQRITTEIQKQLTRTLQTKSPHPRVKSAVGGYRMFLFQDFTVVPLHSKLDVDTLGCLAGHDTESRLHITSDSCCYRLQWKEKYSVCCLNYMGKEVKKQFITLT